VSNGVDPSRFSQALMYHAQRYASLGWPGEPEIDPTQDYEERESVEGWELPPTECMDLAHQSVLRDKSVVAGTYITNAFLGDLKSILLSPRVKYCMYY
jgi:protein phosphatase PTC7